MRPRDHAKKACGEEAACWVLDATYRRTYFAVPGVIRSGGRLEEATENAIDAVFSGVMHDTRLGRGYDLCPEAAR